MDIFRTEVAWKPDLCWMKVCRRKASKIVSIGKSFKKFCCEEEKNNGVMAGIRYIFKGSSLHFIFKMKDIRKIYIDHKT